MRTNDQNAIVHTVLLAEDDENLLFALGTLLEQWGYRVLTARYTQQAIAIMDREAVDVVAADVGQNPASDMYGMALLKHMRELRCYIPVILITGNPSLGTAVEAIDHGVVQYLIKPFDSDVLHTAIRKALSPVIPLSREVTASDVPLSPDRLHEMHNRGRNARQRIAGKLGESVGATVCLDLGPVDLLDASLYAQSAPLSAFACRVIIGLVDGPELQRIPQLMERLSALRRLGYRILVRGKHETGWRAMQGALVP